MRHPLSTNTLVLLLAGCAGTVSETRPAPEATPEPVAETALNLAGTYDATIWIEDMEMFATLTIEAEGEGYRGSISSDMGRMALSDVGVEGQDMWFTVDTPDFEVDFWLNFEGSGFSGEFQAGDFGVGTIAGTKR